jgi:CRISPR system Cascade subunit CasE
MYLSRLILNPRSRQVQRELADPYQMHRTILNAFPESLPSDERVLFRLDQQSQQGLLTLLVQSKHAPDWSRLKTLGVNYLLPDEDLNADMPNPKVKRFDLKLLAGQQLIFRLHANPTQKRTFVGEDGVKKKKRIGIYREEEQLGWLERKLENAGCRLLSARTMSQARVRGQLHRDIHKHKLQFLAVRFEGLLQVVEPERLIDAVHRGIGSGKGLGFGLLSLAPVITGD